jgi:protein involved in temperature-dependent protein secretion
MRIKQQNGGRLVTHIPHLSQLIDEHGDEHGGDGDGDEGKRDQELERTSQDRGGGGGKGDGEAADRDSRVGETVEEGLMRNCRCAAHNSASPLYLSLSIYDHNLE